MPTFSVITVCYNEAESIKKTLDSIVSQTYPDYELIVVDGGSTDGSKDIIKQYESRLAWWCSEQDRGIYHAMNKGVTHATGNYIIFINAGDRFFDENVLMDVYNSKPHTDVIEGYVVRGDKHIRLREKYDDIYVHLFTDTLSHQGSFIKRELLLAHPYDERYKIVADWKFWLEVLILEPGTYSFIDRDIAFYDTTGISSVREKVFEEREKVLQELFPPYVVQLVHSYFDAYTLTVTKYAVYLDKHSPKGYQLIRKIAKRIVKVVKKFKTNPS